MNGDADSLLMLTSYFVLKLVLAAFWAGSLLVLRDVREAFAEVGRPVWIALLILVAAYVFVLQPFVPHTVWQPNNHGAGAAIGLIDGGVPADMMPTHGAGSYLLLRTLHRFLFFGAVSIFTTAYVVSAASLVLLFLVARRLVRSDLAALSAALVLALSPSRLRIAATEAQTIPVEFFLLAAFLHFLLFMDTRKARFFLLGLAATALMMQTRLEFMLFGPALVATLFLVIDPRALLAALRSRACLGGVGAFVLLMTPWALRLGIAIDPRAGSMTELAATTFSQVSRGWRDWRIFLNPFFDPRYGPRLFVALFGVGVVALALRNRRTLALAFMAWVPLGLFFGIHTGGLSTHIRTHAVSLFALALVTGAGVDALARIVRFAVVRRGLVAAMAAGSVASLVPFGAFLGERYSSQVEFDFLLEAREGLPGDAAVAVLLPEDGPPSILTRQYQAWFLAPGTQPDRTVCGLNELRERHEDWIGTRPTYFYRGAPCYVLPVQEDGPWPPEDPAWENPLCTRMFRDYDLEPVAEARLPRASNGFPHDHIQGDGRVIGLYRIRGRKT